MKSHSKHHKAFRQFSSASVFVEYFVDYFGKKRIRISLRDGDVVVKTFAIKTKDIRFFSIGIVYKMFNRELFILLICIW